MSEKGKRCLVCKNYELVYDHCRKGWHSALCDGEDFEPDFIAAVYNFLNFAVESKKISKAQADDLFDWIYSVITWDEKEG